MKPGEIIRIDETGVNTVAIVERTSRRMGRGRMEVADSRGGEVVRCGADCELASLGSHMSNSYVFSLGSKPTIDADSAGTLHLRIRVLLPP